MKTIIAITTLCVFCACSPKQDAHTAQLEAKVTKLTHDVEEAHRRIDLLFDNDKDTITALKAGPAMGTNLMELGLLLFEHVNDTNAHPSLVKPSSAQASRPVPNAVYSAIKIAAAKKWGTDYKMQEYEIKNQVASYLRLNP